MPGLYDLIEQNILTYIVIIQDNDSKWRAPHGVKKPFSRMGVVKHQDLFVKACLELGTHHSFKMSVHPLISSIHKFTYIGVLSDTRPPFSIFYLRPGRREVSDTCVPFQNEKLFDIRNTVDDFLSFFLLLDVDLLPGVEKPWRNEIFRLAPISDSG
jgi:hypothetical protein